jgi:hypothetical protein
MKSLQLFARFTRFNLEILWYAHTGMPVKIDQLMKPNILFQR